MCEANERVLQARARPGPGWWFPIVWVVWAGVGAACGAEARGANKPSGSGASQALPATLGVGREVWIGLRTDGQEGDGTLAQPFNGSGQGFDARLRELSVVRRETNLLVHLLPGVFETRGVNAWYPLSGWKVRGAGMEVTTVKLVGASNDVYAVIHTALGDAEYVEVSDLTVDCNHSPTNLNYASAVVLLGSHHRISRVKAIHAFGLEPIENFTLAIGIGLRPVSEGNVIEDCEVSNFAGYYCSAIFMGGGFEAYNSKFIQGTLRNNKVIGLHNPNGDSVGIAFGNGAVRDFVIEGNVTERVDLAFNADTGRCRNLILRNNRFLACQLRGLSLYGRELENVIVEENLIEMDPRSRDWAISCYDAEGVVSLRDFKIRNNVIRTMNGLYSPAGGIHVAVTEGRSFIVTGNRVEARLFNYFGHPDIFLFDNTDFSGRPVSLAPGSVQGLQLPRQASGHLLADRGGAFRVLEAGQDPELNGAQLVGAYAEVTTLRPHGQALSPTNRASLLLWPGRYRLADGALQLHTSFVDLIGVGGAGSIRLESDGNTLTQTADDVVVENVTLHTEAARPAQLNEHDKAAYFPASQLARTVMRDCVFSGSGQGWPMRLGVVYAGTYERCRAGARAWGSLGQFTGRAVDCSAGDFSFGSGGVFSGSATNCTAGLTSFGGGAVGSGRGFIGVARRCGAGHGSFGGSGAMWDCTVSGALSAGVPTTGRLEDCRIGPPPGPQAAVVVGEGVSLYNCTLLAHPSSGAFSIEALQPVAARVAHCRMNRGMRNVVNLIAEPNNVEDPNID